MNTHIKAYGFKKSLPIEVEVKDLADVKKAPSLFRGPARADFYQIIWLTKGTATFDIDFRKITIKAGEVFLISANQVYGFDTTSTYEGKMILFTSSFFTQTELDARMLHTSELLNPVNLNRIVCPPENFITSITSILENEVNQPIDFFQPYIAQNLLSAILLMCERILTQNLSPLFRRDDLTVARKFSDEVEKYFKTEHFVSFYQDEMAINEKQLAQEVKKMTGQTPKNYIDTRLILEAKRLLTYSTKNIKEISQELGFEEPTNFNKFFRKHLGITPVTFRKKEKKL
ncbi:MAG: AraC family transcriptional regulator [Tannerellaceae bacterium]|nr:AraC family transcriptional regulator [Tannerellaceae bacterium]